jgi:hypothetical protein
MTKEKLDDKIANFKSILFDDGTNATDYAAAI